MINIRQRRQQISTALCEPGRRSIRAIGAVLGISKSSVHRHQAAIAQRNQFPESTLWETAAASNGYSVW